MKKNIIILFFLVIPLDLFSQDNVRLVPDTNVVYYGSKLSLEIKDNSFQPLYYYWSSSSDTSNNIPIDTQTIIVTKSGYYALTVIGFIGESSKLTSYLFQRYYIVIKK